MSELERRWREEADGYRKLAPVSAEETERCADELQAWLREADKALLRGANSLEANLLGGTSQDRGWSCRCLRTELLGTTQKPKQEGESSK